MKINNEKSRRSRATGGRVVNLANGSSTPAKEQRLWWDACQIPSRATEMRNNKNKPQSSGASSGGVFDSDGSPTPVEETDKPSSRERFWWYVIGFTAAGLMSTLFSVFFIYAASTQESRESKEDWVIYYSLNVALPVSFLIYLMWGFVLLNLDTCVGCQHLVDRVHDDGVDRTAKFIWILALIVNIWSIVYIVMSWTAQRDPDNTHEKSQNQSIMAEASIGVVSSIYHVIMVSYFRKVQ